MNEDFEERFEEKVRYVLIPYLTALTGRWTLVNDNMAHFFNWVLFNMHTLNA